MLTVESSECEDHSSPRSFTRQTDGTKRSQKGMWRGAEVLARMDAGLEDARTAQEHDQPQNEDTEGRGAEEGERASDHDMAAPVTDRPRQYHPTRRPGRMTVLSKKHQSTTVESEVRLRSFIQVDQHRLMLRGARTRRTPSEDHALSRLGEKLQASRGVGLVVMMAVTRPCFDVFVSLRLRI